MKNTIKAIAAILLTSSLTFAVEADLSMTAEEFSKSRIDGEATNELKWDLANEGKIFNITGTVDQVFRSSNRYKFGEYSKDEQWAKDIKKLVQDAKLTGLIAVSLNAPKARDYFNKSNFTKYSSFARPQVHFGPEYEVVLSTLRRDRYNRSCR